MLRFLSTTTTATTIQALTKTALLSQKNAITSDLLAIYCTTRLLHKTTVKDPSQVAFEIKRENLKKLNVKSNLLRFSSARKISNEIESHFLFMI